MTFECFIPDIRLKLSSLWNPKKITIERANAQCISSMTVSVPGILVRWSTKALLLLEKPLIGGIKDFDNHIFMHIDYILPKIIQTFKDDG